MPGIIKTFWSEIDASSLNDVEQLDGEWASIINKLFVFKKTRELSGIEIY